MGFFLFEDWVRKDDVGRVGFELADRWVVESVGVCGDNVDSFVFSPFAGFYYGGLDFFGRAVGVKG